MDNKNKNTNFMGSPDIKIDTKKIFGFECPFDVTGFDKKNEYVPDIDHNYKFDPETTKSILAGFSNNKRVLVSGFHGTGKSTHIEQVAARLNWPCIRINLDSHISRIDLIGKDVIVLKDGKQITEFQDGMLPWSYQNPVALVFDEYDAGRPDVMFVIQRILEAEGKLTLVDQARIISPHKYFRLFATANTIGLGDTSGLYHGTQQINQGQIDRWNIVTTLNYLENNEEVEIVLSKVKKLNNKEGKDIIQSMVTTADLTRSGFVNGDISTVMSPRTVITWAENYLIFKDIEYSFKLSFLNRCDELERNVVHEYYQRAFGIDISDAKVINVKE
ncbi:MAG: Aerobic cobaltochelatase subunit CobS [Alphaproteobacteria bacterium MarineAlpha5_Bin8]|nr:MAG: Aerobic cobaltochelatase subunit CobS [Alphaproteobacteria bacterium MarineAlpha5_Bin7]PPR46470.1 MAG: Aerobic cobaltochelatase subunit CobS [Alphaproteobacteria bacterium MarineAlpha5_Bin8]PPR53859.1 MAG: Aerobic cobaltochelatase subunit CobS [Alphaproteobacteria bacterium MarineAlpha5_Bin6]|tara:strand:- start:15278 stop:16270 length:993 start_codon:yes stop_codon:yes gene_type:complete